LVRRDDENPQRKIPPFGGTFLLSLNLRPN
jgi:hypothetical protein